MSSPQPHGAPLSFNQTRDPVELRAADLSEQQMALPHLRHVPPPSTAASLHIIPPKTAEYSSVLDAVSCSRSNARSCQHLARCSAVCNMTCSGDSGGYRWSAQQCWGQRSDIQLRQEKLWKSHSLTLSSAECGDPTSSNPCQTSIWTPAYIFAIAIMLSGLDGSTKGEGGT